MASSIIHMAVASELNKKLKKDNKSILIGSIAPDISKQIDKSKLKSHFQNNDNDIPDLNKFLASYKSDLEDDFVLGYYIHLYTDYIWFKYFITDYIKNTCVYDINNNKLHLSDEERIDYIYNDYTNLNIKVIDRYNLELNIFYEEHPNFKNIIKEIPMDKINIIIEKTGLIIENSKETKSILFDLTSITRFIDFCVKVIIDDLKNLGIYKVLQ